MTFDLHSNDVQHDDVAIGTSFPPPAATMEVDEVFVGDARDYRRPRKQDMIYPRHLKCLLKRDVTEEEKFHRVYISLKCGTGGTRQLDVNRHLRKQLGISKLENN